MRGAEDERCADAQNVEGWRKASDHAAIGVA
jgi:hypothetical protein